MFDCKIGERCFLYGFGFNMVFLIGDLDVLKLKRIDSVAQRKQLFSADFA